MEDIIKPIKAALAYLNCSTKAGMEDGSCFDRYEYHNKFIGALFKANNIIYSAHDIMEFKLFTISITNNLSDHINFDIDTPRATTAQASALCDIFQEKLEEYLDKQTKVERYTLAGVCHAICNASMGIFTGRRKDGRRLYTPDMCSIKYALMGYPNRDINLIHCFIKHIEKLEELIPVVWTPEYVMPLDCDYCSFNNLIRFSYYDIIINVVRDHKTTLKAAEDFLRQTIHEITTSEWEVYCKHLYAFAKADVNDDYIQKIFNNLDIEMSKHPSTFSGLGDDDAD